MYMHGSKSGVKIGRKHGHRVIVRTSYPGRQGTVDTAEYCILPLPDAHGPFAMPGDSGSPIYDEEVVNGHGRYRLSGMLWGGTQGKSVAATHNPDNITVLTIVVSSD
jgi:hypothetical protein